jgi:hypothetical protein
MGHAAARMAAGIGRSKARRASLTPQDSGSIGGRAHRRAAPARTTALVLTAAACALAAAPALGARSPLHPVVAAAAPAALDGTGTPRPGGEPAPGARHEPEAPDADADADGAPRPVARRPTAGGPAAGGALAVRDVRVPARVALDTARGAGIAVSFVPRPGSLVAEVRLYRRDGDSGRRLVARRLIAVRGGRRTTAHVGAAAVRRGAYELSMRAGAQRATLAPEVVARILIV